MHREFIALFLALAVSCSSWAKSPESSKPRFKWLDPTKTDVKLYTQIKAVFGEELKPDDPEKVKPVVAMTYKKISRIGVFQSWALVLILERETPASKYGDYFEPFNYNLRTGKKEGLGKGFYLWKFNKLARFEPSAVPDIVFTYWSCTECEADRLLASFRFDKAVGGWDLRSWGRGEGDSLIIGDDGEPLSEEDETNHDCLFGFGDFIRNGFANVAVRCLAIDQRNRVVGDTTMIYAVEHGQPQTLAVKDPSQLDAIRKALCTGVKNSKLCPPR